MIVDEFTGRVLSGRRYSEGLTRLLKPKKAFMLKKIHRHLLQLLCRTISGFIKSLPV